ncbi:MAG: VWA domain-containing protein [Gammaproteobacteria bacterium]
MSELFRRAFPVPALVRIVAVSLCSFSFVACTPEPGHYDTAQQSREQATSNKPLADPAPADSAIQPATIPLVSPAPTPALLSKRETSVPTSRAADSLAPLRPAAESLDRERYAELETNPVQRVSEAPVSTFSIDVDTGAYTNIRRILREGRLPPTDAVRIEEMINYFRYDYPAPTNRRTPFQVTTELGPSPWNPNTRLLLVGLQGYRADTAELPPANLVFLLDVSGSMRAPDKLPLLQSALRLLTAQLRPQDRVSIVVYAGASGLVLEPTSRRDAILSALNQLSAGGSTNGGAGIQLAYQVAEQAFIPNGINRVLLATDGDFNVGTVNFETLKDMVAAKRKSGIALSTLGFGRGNYNDQLMEQLADVGNGNYAYIDSLQEARKTLVEELGSTLLTIAKDVKIQLEFNPVLVEEYRLIGYENRILQREDFNNDSVDAGEIGAGHSVTALYEIALHGSGGSWNDPLRYQPATTAVEPTGKAQELAFLRLRYKMPDSDRSDLLEYPVTQAMLQTSLDTTSQRFRFASAVAAFGQYLRGGQYLNGMELEAVRTLAANARGDDDNGYRSELLQLIDLAADLGASAAPPQTTN